MHAEDAITTHTAGDASKPVRARRKPGVRTPAPEAEKRSLNLRIDEDSYQRLNIHALMRKKTVSDLVMEFAQTQLREFVVHRRSIGGTDVVQS